MSPKKEKIPADERPSDYVLHLVIPAVLAMGVLGFSLLVDLRSNTETWTQRAGAVVTVVGAYFAYYENKASIKFIEGVLFLNPRLPYKVISLVFVLLGTIVWGYGDVIMQWAFR